MAERDKSQDEDGDGNEFVDQVESVGDRDPADASGVLGGDWKAHGEHSGETTNPAASADPPKAPADPKPR